MKNISISIYALSLSFFLLCSANTSAQTKNHEKEISEQVETFFKGLNAKDTLVIKSTLGNDVSLKSLMIKDGEKQLFSENIHEFLKQIGRLTDDLIIREEIDNVKINLRFPLADVFTDYTFYVNDEQSHSGINLFTLAYLNDAWKIINMVDTRQ
ncbi:hypothetical protein [Psychroflexus planctonicus]|uniref:Lumazine-binding n=1 Tax=Psychroflexus planctonicus TaxID=1526575 RepID=A0ABQ1SF81_9FLAO|nr:hypothetical protein [Psychroflexus planctonicus]GGE36042.1 hypothetical protein GCM10010832_15300 [Psychroflexus planctonicus]